MAKTASKGSDAPKGDKPKLGQHFLVDDAASVSIVEALGDISLETVLEIGPGRGALTSLLARRCRRLIAIELDRVMAAQLRMKFGLTPNVEILEGDVLTMDFDAIFGPKPGSVRPGLDQPIEPVEVVGNLPYYITSDILLRLFEYRRYFRTCVLMVQSEVADRLVAQPGNSEYGILSATTQLYAEVETILSLLPSSFSPPPKVNSKVVRLRMNSRVESLGLAKHEKEFIAFLRKSFAQKRKTLWNNLKEDYPSAPLKSAFSKAKVDSAARAEDLSLEQSAALFLALGANAAAR